MAQWVIKKNGGREPFDETKLRRGINKALEESGTSHERIEELGRRIADLVLQSINSLAEISSDKIANLVVSELDVFAPEAAGAWREYRRAKEG